MKCGQLSSYAELEAVIFIASHPYILFIFFHGSNSS